MATWNAAGDDPIGQDVFSEAHSSTAPRAMRVLHGQAWDTAEFMQSFRRTFGTDPVSAVLETEDTAHDNIYGLVCSRIVPLSPDIFKMEPSDVAQLAVDLNHNILVAGHRNNATSLMSLNKEGIREIRFEVDSFSLGAFLDPFQFSCHGVVRTVRNTENWTRQRIGARFDFLEDQLTIEIEFRDGSDYSQHRMDFSFSKLKRDYIVTRDPATKSLAIFVYYTTPPKIWKEVTMDPTAGDDAKFWARDTEVPGFCDGYPGFCSVLKIELGTPPFIKFNQWKAKMELGRFNLWWGNLTTVECDTGQRMVKNILDDDRTSTWAMKCLFSLGYKVTDNISSKDLKVLRATETQYPQLFTRAVKRLIYSKLAKDPVVNTMEAFREIWQSLVAEGGSAGVDPDFTPSDDSAAIRHALVTPSAVRYLPPEPRDMNRVVRHFKAENFINVTFCDEHENKLCTMSAPCLKNPVERIKKVLKAGIFSDGRRFVYLGSSNSQLRKHGCWFYASTGQLSIFDIREWMGDLSAIRCVALYVSRIGQFFSTSKPTVELKSDQVEKIPDITTVSPTRSTYCFTDGVGKISSKLAAQVARTMDLEQVPSAYQIRMGGIKGVLAVDPSLGNRLLVQVRPSMEKFPSDQYVLEVTHTSTPNVLHLNRQVVSLLSGAGITDKVFLELEEDYLLELEGMFLSEVQAVRYLSECRLGFNIQDLLTTGYQILLDPFFRSLLIAKYEDCLWELSEKARVPISPDKGRLMMGVVDETCTLQYGQVFVQYSTHVHCPQKNTTVRTGHVVIAKSPCFHPGDLRKFDAVDCPQLRHMVDVVVFPSVGLRPHPNEISGSDLDGDLYWVCWHEKLIPVRNNCTPMNFSVSPSQCLDNDLSEDDVIDYIGEYIKHDHIGLIANAHVVFADREGVDSKECLKLAQIHSDAVDFPKTGNYPRVIPALRPKRYPDFMGKNHVLTYHSRGILGKLYRLCQVLARSDVFGISENHSQNKVPLENVGSKPSREAENTAKMYTEAEKAYENYAIEMIQILSPYGLIDEADLVAGSESKFQQKGTQRKKTFEIMQLAQRKWRRLQQNMYCAFEKGCRNEIQKRAKALVWAEVAKTKQFPSFAWIPGRIAIEVRKGAEKPLTKGHQVQDDINVMQTIASGMTTLSAKQELPLYPNELIHLLQTILEKNTSSVLHLAPVHLTGLDLSSNKLVLPIMVHVENTGNSASSFTSDMELLQDCERTLSQHGIRAGRVHNMMVHFKKITLRDSSNLVVESTLDVARGHQVSQEIVLTTSREMHDLTGQLSTMFRHHPSMVLTAEIIVEWANVEKLLVNNPKYDVLDIIALLIPLESSLPDSSNTFYRASTPARSTQASRIPKFGGVGRDDVGMKTPRSGLASGSHAADSAVQSVTLLVHFFMTYSRRNNLVEAFYLESRCFMPRPRVILKRYTDAAISVLHMSVTRACSLLLTSLSIDRIIGPQESICGDVERRLHSLSEETHRDLLGDQKHLCRCIEERTSCSIFIHKDTYKEIPIFTSEAVGDRASLNELDKELEHLQRINWTRPGQTLYNIYAPDSYLGLFEGSTSQNDSVNLVPYKGPGYKPRGKKKTPMAPVLRLATRQTGSDTLFKEMWRKRMDILRDSYDPDYLGDLRIIARFGRAFYIVKGRKSMSIEELNRQCNVQTKFWSHTQTRGTGTDNTIRDMAQGSISCPGNTNDGTAATKARVKSTYKGKGHVPSALESSVPGRQTMTNKITDHSVSPTPPPLHKAKKPPQIRPVFYPETINRDQIQMFLDAEGFIEHDRESLIVCLVYISPERFHEGEIVLNGRLEYTNFRLRSQRWCSVVVHSLASGQKGQASYDVRVQVQSLKNVPKESVDQYREFTHPKESILFYKTNPPSRSFENLSLADELDPRAKLNLTTCLPEINVHPEHTGKVKFVRQKEVVKYKLTEQSPHRCSRFTDHVELHVSRVQEYEGVRPNGTWANMYEAKDEVILVVPSDGFPRLNQVDEWDEIGSQLMAMGLKFSHAVERRK